MRFNVLLSISFLATLAAGLVIPSLDDEARNLDVREGLVHDAADSVVFKREPKTSNAKKARIAAAAPAKAAKKAAKKASFQPAAKAHRQTANLPGRHSTFHVKAGNHPNLPAHTFTGKDVRKAVFDRVHKAKPFYNRPHRAPQPQSGGNKPLPHMTVNRKQPHAPPGREIDLPNHHNPAHRSPARVITQKTAGSNHAFMGVVAHNQANRNGLNDHFQVPENKPAETKYQGVARLLRT